MLNCYSCPYHVIIINYNKFLWLNNFFAFITFAVPISPISCHCQPRNTSLCPSRLTCGNAEWIERIHFLTKGSRTFDYHDTQRRQQRAYFIITFMLTLLDNSGLQPMRSPPLFYGGVTSQSRTPTQSLGGPRSSSYCTLASAALFM